MSTYKGIDYVDPSTPPTPGWGTQEFGNWCKHADWIGGDCIDTDYTATGHKHGKVYDGYGTVIIDADNELNIVYIGTSENEYENIDVIIGNGSASEFRLTNADDDEALTYNGDDGILDLGCSTTKVEVNLPAATAEAFKMSVGSTDFFKYDTDDSELHIGDASDVIMGGNDGTCLILLSDNKDGPFSIACGTQASNDPIIECDTLNGSEETRIGTNVSEYPLTVDSAGAVFTRDTMDLAHTVYGINTLTDDRVKVFIIGKFALVTFELFGVSSNAEFYMGVPFAIEEGELATAHHGSLGGYFDGQNNSVSVQVKAWYEADDGANPNRIVFSVWNGSPAGWETYNNKGVWGRFVVTLADPEFSNSMS